MGNRVKIFVICYLIKISKPLLQWKTGNVRFFDYIIRKHQVQVHQWHHHQHHLMMMMTKVQLLLQKGYLHLQMSCQARCHHPSGHKHFLKVFLDHWKSLSSYFLTFWKKKKKKITKCCQTAIFISNHYQIKQDRRQSRHCIAFK